MIDMADNGPTRTRRPTARPVKIVSSDATGNEMTSDEWCTGPEISVPLYDFWGLCGDPCSNDRSIIRTHSRYTEFGLQLPWWKQTYENHPYSTNDPWQRKACYELKLGRVSELVVLCMMAPSTAWWRGFMTEPKRNPRVIATKRLKFLGPDGNPQDSSRFDPALIYIGRRVAAFDKHFAHVAMWSTWGR